MRVIIGCQCVCAFRSWERGLTALAAIVPSLGREGVGRYFFVNDVFHEYLLQVFVCHPNVELTTEY